MSGGRAEETLQQFFLDLVRLLLIKLTARAELFDLLQLRPDSVWIIELLLCLLADLFRHRNSHP